MRWAHGSPTGGAFTLTQPYRVHGAAMWLWIVGDQARRTPGYWRHGAGGVCNLQPVHDRFSGISYMVSSCMRQTTLEWNSPLRSTPTRTELRARRRRMRYLAMCQPIVSLFFQPMPSPLPMISVPEPLRTVRLPG